MIFIKDVSQKHTYGIKIKLRKKIDLNLFLLNINIDIDRSAIHAIEMIVNQYPIARHNSIRRFAFNSVVFSDDARARG